MKIYTRNECCGRSCAKCRDAKPAPVIQSCDGGYIILFQRSPAGMSYKAKNGRRFDV